MSEGLTPVRVNNTVGTIEDNLNEVEASIREKVVEYKGIVITEDGVKDGKNLLASIRKDKKALDDERKAVKKAWMAPYNAFEERAKKIVALYDEPINAINEQLNEYEERRKAEKNERIKAIYAEVEAEHPEAAEYVSLDGAYDQRWLNVSVSEKLIRDGIELEFNAVEAAVNAIRSMESEFEADGLEALKESGSLQAALEKMNALKKQKERVMEQAVREAEEKLRREAEEKERQAKREAEEKERLAREAEERERLAVEEEKERLRRLKEEIREREERGKEAYCQPQVRNDDGGGELESVCKVEAESQELQTESQEDEIFDFAFLDSVEKKYRTLNIYATDAETELVRAALESYGIEYKIEG